MFSTGSKMQGMASSVQVSFRHPEHLVPENGLQFLEFQGRRDAKHPFAAVKTAVRQKDVAVGTESEKIIKNLDGNHRAGEGIQHKLQFIFKHPS